MYHIVQLSFQVHAIVIVSTYFWFPVNVCVVDNEDDDDDDDDEADLSQDPDE